MHVKSIVGLGGVIVIASFAIGACGSNDNSQFGNGNADSGSSGNNIPEGGGFGGGDGSVTLDGGNPYANDPPPTYCILDGGATPAEPGGTAACPDDKNLPGCPCSPAGTTAACWTGLRKNRDLGQCKDGTTTCGANGEIGDVWGECQGEVLPQAGATKGKAACQCFSAGQWLIANTSPCFVTSDNTTYYAESTIPSGTAGQYQCPAVTAVPPTSAPSQDWSSDTLNVDCAGHFKLCYEIKAGAFANPLPTDCSIAKVCAESDYDVANAVQPFPNLPAWTSSNSTCATQFYNTGGYGEMSVVGEDILCDEIPDNTGNAEVFNRVNYCPISCNTDPTGPGCTGCQSGSGGSF